MKNGIDVLIRDKKLQQRLEGKRVSLLAHPASVTESLEHSIEAILRHTDIRITSAFGPQHGMKGDKQDNMIESDDYIDGKSGFPVFSLYGKVRRPTPQMLDTFDAILVDLQDLGCRIYTFITTMFYILEASAGSGKEVWILDRPNPAGRPVEGLALRKGWESFVGGGPLPMRHGLTMGELALWYKELKKLNLDLHILRMEGWQPDRAPGFGWPPTRSWVNPSPNAATLNMARCYAGTVLFEGTTLSEARGTSRPLEMFGAPDIDSEKILTEMYSLKPEWLKGSDFRLCHFEPVFHKHQFTLCNGIQIHCDGHSYRHHEFKPWRAICLYLKALRTLYPEYGIWRNFDYEYETGKAAIDVINGSEILREWVESKNSRPEDLESLAVPDEDGFKEISRQFMIY